MLYRILTRSTLQTIQLFIIYVYLNQISFITIFDIQRSHPYRRLLVYFKREIIEMFA